MTKMEILQIQKFYPNNKERNFFISLPNCNKSLISSTRELHRWPCHDKNKNTAQSGVLFCYTFVCFCVITKSHIKAMILHIVARQANNTKQHNRTNQEHYKQIHSQQHIKSFHTMYDNIILPLVQFRL